MKRTIGILTTVVALGGCVYLGSHLRAQQPAAPGAAVQPAVTRVAIINLGQVIRNYVKFKNFEQYLNGQRAQYRQKMEGMSNLLQTKQALLAKPETSQVDREKIEREARDLQRQMQDLKEDAQEHVSKQEFDQLVQMYKEVQDAVAAYARVRNIEMVLHNNEPIGNDAWLPQIFSRKLANGACFPLYVHPGLDITNDIINMLNSRVAQTAAPPAAPPVQPTNYQPQR
jgi:Skp family chaperone for outer membrane proteins